MENPLARAIVAGEFRPGDRITADADLVSGTILFSTEGRTVVGDGSRRDARSASNGDQPAGVGAGGEASSPLDLPPTRRPKRGGDGELVN